MEPMVDAVIQAIEQLRRDMHEGLAGHDADALNWRPYPDGNTIAGLLAHMVESGQFVLRTGRGETPDRDRDSQFFATATDAAAILAATDRGLDAILDLARGYDAEALAARHAWRGATPTGAWFLLRVCDHLHEHWGQIQTTRDLAVMRAK